MPGQRKNKLYLRIYEVMKLFYYLLLLIFRPALLIKKFPRFSDEFVKIRQSLFYSFVIVLFAVLFGCSSGLIINYVYAETPLIWIQRIQYFSIGILLWATLAKIGRLITWSQNSIPEKLDNYIYKILYFIGSSLLVLSVTLS